MENNSILDTEIRQSLSLNSSSKNKFIRVAQWAKFIAIMLFINSIYMIYQFVQMTIATQYSRSRNNLEFGELVSVLTMIAVIIFTFFAAYNLWNFANSAILGLRKNNPKIFAISIESLRSYFKFYGLFMVVIAIITAMIFYTIYYLSNLQGL